MNSTYDEQYFFGQREQVITRDCGKCVVCGITRSEHVLKYSRDITVDHIDGRGRNTDDKNNDMSNLQTLCLHCHGKKDAPNKLTEAQALRIYLAEDKTERNFLCDEFGVNRQAGVDIMSGKSWSSVTGAKRKYLH